MALEIFSLPTGEVCDAETGACEAPEVDESDEVVEPDPSGFPPPA